MYPDRIGPFFWGALFSFFFVMTKSSCTILCQQSFLRWKATNVSVENWHLSLPSLWCALPPSLGPRSTELTLEASLRSLVMKNPLGLSVPGGHEESRDVGGAGALYHRSGGAVLLTCLLGSGQELFLTLLKQEASF